MLSSIGNYYERLVMECIHETLAQSGDTPDPDYTEDLACVALNNLPPRYIRHSVDLASHLGDDERRAMDQAVADAVNLAIATITRRRQAREV